MASSLLRWGLLTLSAAVVALALALHLQHPIINSYTSPSVTHCYKSITTQDEDRPSAKCFSVIDGHFSGVLTEEQVAASPQPLIEHPGYVIPGLWDGHGHLLQYGEFLHSVDLFGSLSLDDVRSRLKEYIGANPGTGTKEHWVRGVGWDQAAFGRMPTAVSHLSTSIHPSRSY